MFKQWTEASLTMADFSGVSPPTYPCSHISYVIYLLPQEYIYFVSLVSRPDIL